MTVDLSKISKQHAFGNLMRPVILYSVSMLTALIVTLGTDEKYPNVMIKKPELNMGIVFLYIIYET